MAKTEFFHLNHVSEGAKLVSTGFLPAEFEGKPTAWLIPATGEFQDYSHKDGDLKDHCDRFIIRTNMSVIHPSKLYLCTDDNGINHFRDSGWWGALDIGQGSYEACKAIIRLYNM